MKILNTNAVRRTPATTKRADANSTDSSTPNASANGSALPSLPYIPHLDGLRAVALAAVLLFHFEAPNFGGGFAGVDVFLTLSGFLITSNILHRRAHNVFSLRAFYVRRFFRLYPAATCTVLISVIGAYLMFPEDLTMRVCLSAVASMLFSSNIYFHSRNNYFDEESIVKPLLHMWSLSLEEQFYLIWAPILVLTTSTPARRNLPLIVVSVLAVLSLGVSVVFADRYPSFVFFELPPRIFQFAAGGILAIVRSEPEGKNSGCSDTTSASTMKAKNIIDGSHSIFNAFSKLRVKALASRADALSVFAMAVLILSFMFLPSAASPVLMIPTMLATMVLIAMSPNTPVAQFLSSPPIRFVGRISYSAYLLHWPFYVFTRYIARTLRFSKVPASAMVIVTLVSAWLMYRSVELPARRRTSMHIQAIIALLVIITAVISLLGVATQGFAFRVPYSTSKKAAIKRWYKTVNQRTKYKVRDGDYTARKKAGVSLGLSGDFVKGNMSSVVFFGNSYVGMWRWALSTLGVKRGVYFKLYQRAGCGLLTPTWKDKLSKKCLRSNDQMWKIMSTIPAGSYIGLSPYWYGFKNTSELAEALEDVALKIRRMGLELFVLPVTPGLAEGARSFFACADMAWAPLGSLWSRLRGFSGDDKWIFDCLPGLLERGYEPYRGRVERDRMVKSVMKPNNVTYFDLFGHLCGEIPDHLTNSQVQCHVPANWSYGFYDIGYARDRHHLSPFGSFSLTSFLEDSLVKLGALQPIMSSSHGTIDSKSRTVRGGK